MDASPFQPQASHTCVTEREREREERARTTHKHGTQRGPTKQPNPPSQLTRGETRGGQRKPTDDAFITFPRSTGGLCGCEHLGVNPCHGHTTRPGLPDVGNVRLRGRTSPALRPMGIRGGTPPSASPCGLRPRAWPNKCFMQCRDQCLPCPRCKVRRYFGQSADRRMLRVQGRIDRAEIRKASALRQPSQRPWIHPRLLHKGLFLRNLSKRIIPATKIRHHHLRLVHQISAKRSHQKRA